MEKTQKAQCPNCGYSVTVGARVNAERDAKVTDMYLTGKYTQRELAQQYGLCSLNIAITKELQRRNHPVLKPPYCYGALTQNGILHWLGDTGQAKVEKLKHGGYRFVQEQ